jgi:hypothetical protein
MKLVLLGLAISLIVLLVSIAIGGSSAALAAVCAWFAGAFTMSALYVDMHEFDRAVRPFDE